MSGKKEPTIARTTLLTVIAMLAFAANSLLCRLALAQGLIDAASFTSVRIIAGAVTLGLIMLFRKGTNKRLKTNWRTVAMLFAYMVFFSFAYLSLSAGTGALLLFGSVQLTMFAVALHSRCFHGEDLLWRFSDWSIWCYRVSPHPIHWARSS